MERKETVLTEYKEKGGYIEHSENKLIEYKLIREEKEK